MRVLMKKRGTGFLFQNISFTDYVSEVDSLSYYSRTKVDLGNTKIPWVNGGSMLYSTQTSTDPSFDTILYETSQTSATPVSPRLFEMTNAFSSSPIYYRMKYIINGIETYSNTLTMENNGDSSHTWNISWQGSSFTSGVTTYNRININNVYANYPTPLKLTNGTPVWFFNLGGGSYTTTTFRWTISGTSGVIAGWDGSNHYGDPRAYDKKIPLNTEITQIRIWWVGGNFQTFLPVGQALSTMGTADNFKNTGRAVVTINY